MEEQNAQNAKPGVTGVIDAQPVMMPVETAPLVPRTETKTELEARTKAERDAEVETPLESIASIASVLVAGLFVMTFVGQNFVIPSGSMEKTLLVGDHVLVDRTTLAPKTSWMPLVHYRDVERGDIIVFYKPNTESPDLVLVKRTVGLPGDRIHLQHGVVYLNGTRLNEPFAKQVVDGAPQPNGYDPDRDDFPAHGAPPSTLTPEVWTLEEPSHVVNGDLVVPPGTVFAMGDNRTESLDGRYWGFVPRENILGRPLFNYWSFEATADQMTEENANFASKVGAFFTTGIHIFDRTRWTRTFHVIR